MMSTSPTNGAPLDPSPGTLSQEDTHAAKPEKHTYGQILKATAYIGGSSVLNIGIGIVRTKVTAILLGPAGFGLSGLYGSVATLTQNIAGMGIDRSGVRQIAEAVSTGDTKRIAQTTAVLRRTSIVLGSLGALLLLVFSKQISISTFGNDHHKVGICVLAAVVFLQLVSAGQAALIQGMRRIADLAKIAVLGASFGTIFTIPILYFLRENGVVPSLVIVALMTICTSWWYARKVEIEIPHLKSAEVTHEAFALLKLGFAFMASGVMLTGVAYWVRILVLHKVGLEGAGWYQSAWTLGGLYVGLIIQSMGADFYPRLTAAAQDHPLCNRLVNEQARVGMLLACPGALATLTFTPLVITLFYTAKFGAAVGVLRWICLGTTLQVVTWPMGFIIVAKGRQTLFFWSEFACAAAYAALSWVFIKSVGLNGAGIAFCAYSVFHGLLHYPIVNRLSGFRWSAANIKTGVFFLGLIAAVFCGFTLLPFLWAASLGALCTIAASAYSIRSLSRVMSWHQIPSPIRSIITKLGFAPQSVP